MSCFFGCFLLSFLFGSNASKARTARKARIARKAGTNLEDLVNQLRMRDAYENERKEKEKSKKKFWDERQKEYDERQYLEKNNPEEYISKYMPELKFLNPKNFSTMNSCYGYTGRYILLFSDSCCTRQTENGEVIQDISKGQSCDSYFVILLEDPVLRDLCEICGFYKKENFHDSSSNELISPEDMWNIIKKNILLCRSIIAYVSSLKDARQAAVDAFTH